MKCGVINKKTIKVHPQTFHREKFTRNRIYAVDVSSYTHTHSLYVGELSKWKNPAQNDFYTQAIDK